MKRNNLSIAAVVASAATLAPKPASAHPGHGIDNSDTLTHFLLSPGHVPAAACVVGIAAVLALAVAVRRIRVARSAT